MAGNLHGTALSIGLHLRDHTRSQTGLHELRAVSQTSQSVEWRGDADNDNLPIDSMPSSSNMLSAWFSVSSRGDVTIT